MEIIKKITTTRFDNLKEYLKVELQMSDRLLLKLKTYKKLYINNQNVPINTKININDIIKINLDFEEDNSNIIPTKMVLDIIYDDDSLLIVNKPSSLATHPSILHFDNSLLNGIKYYYDTIGLQTKLRPINRLDKDTTGIVIIAKNQYIQECLVKQMKVNIFKKEYLALVEGHLKDSSGVINVPIARKENSIIERCVSSDGVQAITHYSVIKEFDNYSLLKINLETGRTHQIRVHMAYIGNPILGDTLYGTASKLIFRQALHAWKISFIHPITNAPLSIEANLPKDMLDLIENIF